MATFIKKHIIWLICTALLVTLTGYQVYAARKGEANEKRIMAIETALGVNTANIKSLEKTIDVGFDNLSKQITHNESLILSLLERN